MWKSKKMEWDMGEVKRMLRVDIIDEGRQPRYQSTSNRRTQERWRSGEQACTAEGMDKDSALD
jgi:hypothetical protein